MKCPVCGADNASNFKFCISCGSVLVDEPEIADPPVVSADAPVVEGALVVEAPIVMDDPVSQEEPIADTTEDTTSAPDAPQRKKNKFVGWGILAGVIGGVLLLILAIVLVLVLNKGNGYIQLKESITYFNSGEDEYSIVVGKKVLKTTIESEEGIRSSAGSMDGKVKVFLTYEGDLYVAKGSKLISVAEDVVSYRLSVEGDGIAYSTRVEDAETTSLYLAKVSNGKSTEITDNLANSNFAISPDGKSVAYFEDGDDADDLMLFNGKKSTRIYDDEDADLYLYGLSDKGKQIYVNVSEKERLVESDSSEAYTTDTDSASSASTMYSFNQKGQKTKLGDCARVTNADVYFNADHTQIIFLNEEYKTYISTKGKEATKVISSSLRLLVAPNSVALSDTYPVSDLYDHVYKTGEGEAYLVKKNKVVKLVSKASRMQLDGDAEYLYYCYDDSEIRYIKISHGAKATEKAKTVLNESTYFLLTPNRKYIYYMDGGDTLMRVNAKRGGTGKQIADDVDYNYGLGICISNENILYYIMDDDLYAVSGFGKGTKVLSDVDYAYSSANGYVYAFNDDAVFVSTGSKKLKQVIERDN